MLCSSTATRNDTRVEAHGEVTQSRSSLEKEKLVARMPGLDQMRDDQAQDPVAQGNEQVSLQ